MTVNDLISKLNLTILAGKNGISNEVKGGYVCDLLSDVMGHADAGVAWITLQTHKNVMAIASLKELSCIIIIKGFSADKDMLEKAEEEGIPVLQTEESAFDITGKLYELLKS